MSCRRLGLLGVLQPVQARHAVDLLVQVSAAVPKLDGAMVAPGHRAGPRGILVALLVEVLRVVLHLLHC